MQATSLCRAVAMAVAVAALLPCRAAAQSLNLTAAGEYATVPHAPELAPVHVTVEAWVVLDPSS